MRKYQKSTFTSCKNKKPAAKKGTRVPRSPVRLISVFPKFRSSDLSRFHWFQAAIERNPGLLNLNRNSLFGLVRLLLSSPPEMATKGNVSIKIEDDDDVEVGGVADSLWSKKNEAFFIDIMEEEVKTMGSRDTGTFQIKCWARMRKSLSAKAKYEYSELQIKNKFNQLRTMHTKFKSLCNQSGVGWCAEKGTITADDTLWEKLYKVRSDLFPFILLMLIN
ncbi:hypothetical protein RHMOL_Rhmol08G0125700 [Rhododendron molle]|uniref:Uncharacterized protein n=1 Tax=Rhododendron molle TaxID=49168 RepID=A0ACC0MMJ2_RHOML|nr:hypothetical protein RHMOL_Rhmol08G0125700 [Rhododendron molle]